MAQLSEAARATADSQRESAEAIESLDQAARILHDEVSAFKVTDTATPAAVGTAA